MIVSHSFDPKGFLDVSKEIVYSIKDDKTIKPSNENNGWLRSAMSRAYYAAFLTLREQFVSTPDYPIQITHEAEDHGKIISALKKDLPRQLKKFSNDMMNLRMNRDIADYDLHPFSKIDETLVETSNIQAEEIIKNAKTIVNSMIT